MTYAQYCQKIFDLTYDAFKNGYIDWFQFDDILTAASDPESDYHNVCFPSEVKEWKQLRNMEWPSFDTRNRLDNVQFKKWTPTRYYPL